MQTRLAKFEAAGPPPDRPAGAEGRRCGCAAAAPACARSSAEQLELTGLMQPFDVEIFYGERVGVLGANGAGKSHFLRLLGRRDGRAHRRVAARRAGRPRAFAQTHAHPEWLDRTLVDLLWHGEPRPARASTAAGRWRRCAATGCADQGDQLFGTLSGGQQARFQILLLELSGATLLLLDEPTDNLDVLVGRGAGGGAGRLRRHGRSRSPTTAGSPGRSTASWCSVATAASTSRPNRSSTTRNHCADDGAPPQLKGSLASSVSEEWSWRRMGRTLAQTTAQTHWSVLCAHASWRWPLPPSPLSSR